MASYPPPSFFSSIFDSNAFAHGNDNDGLTEAEANLLYYKYPVGQPFQTLQQTDHTGLATFNAGIDIQTGTLTFPDNTVQTTAATAGTNLLPLNNVWTGTNQFQSTTTMLNNLSMNSITAIANRQITSSYYNFYATDNVATLTYSGRFYGNLNGIVYDCPDTNATGSSSHVFYNYNNATALNSLTISNTGITNNTTQPASNNSSTIVPTTAWVQSAIAGAGAGSLSAVLLVGNNAGATDIDMNNNDINNCATVSGLHVSSRLTNINIGSGNQNLTSTGNGYNIAIGNTIMPIITTAKNNNMVGSSSGSGLIDGQGNNGFGSNALNAVSSGDFNVAIGNNTGKLLTTGSYNVFLGSQAGQNNLSGSSNVCVGNGAGQTDTGSNNTCIGESTSIGGGVSNSTAIGQGATTSTANTIQLGKNTHNVNCPNTLSVVGTITNTATQPASNDSSTKVPTTAWVQGAIASITTGINQMWSWNAFNITGALPGGAIRTASLVLPYSSAITFSTSCRIEFNYAIFSNSATTQTVIPNLLSAYTGQAGGTNVNPNTFSQVDLVFNPTTQTMNSFICQSTFANIFTNTTTKYWRGNSAYNFVPIKFAQTAPITLNSPSAGFMTINLDVGFPAINYSSNPNYLGNLCSISTSIRITASQATTTDTIGITTYSSGVGYFL